MSETQEMAAFVTARLGEWEAAAKAAAADCPSPWRDDYGDLIDASGTMIVDGVDYGGAAWRGDTIPHIAAHDPATTLLLVASLRKLIELAGEAGGLDLQVQNAFGVGLREEPYIDEVMLRWAAAIWSDHPDYRQEWKP